MKRFHSIVAIFALGISMAVTAVFAVASACRSQFLDITKKVSGAVKRVFMEACEMAAQGQVAVYRAVILLVAARSFTQRIERRERMQVTASWRLVPSV